MSNCKESPRNEFSELPEEKNICPHCKGILSPELPGYVYVNVDFLNQLLSDFESSIHLTNSLSDYRSNRCFGSLRLVQKSYMDITSTKQEELLRKLFNEYEWTVDLLTKILREKSNRDLESIDLVRSYLTGSSNDLFGNHSQPASTAEGVW